jgi:hypothetical protein
MADLTTISLHCRQQISTKIQLLFIKFVRIFSSLFWNANDNKQIINECNENDSIVGKDAAEEQPQKPQERLELSLEMHNEVILFATRETLATLMEFDNWQSHIGSGVAFLATKRLQSIRVGSGYRCFAVSQVNDYMFVFLDFSLQLISFC